MILPSLTMGTPPCTRMLPKVKTRRPAPPPEGRYHAGQCEGRRDGRRSARFRLKGTLVRRAIDANGPSLPFEDGSCCNAQRGIPNNDMLGLTALSVVPKKQAASVSRSR